MKPFLYFISGFAVASFTIFGCGSTPIFPWTYYNFVTTPECYQQGTLLGKQGAGGWPDLAGTTCEPDPIPSPGASPSVQPNLDKCMTMKLADFTALKTSYLQCQNDLSACQSQLAGQ